MQQSSCAASVCYLAPRSPKCFDVKTAQLMLFGMLLVQLSDATRLHVGEAVVDKVRHEFVADAVERLPAHLTCHDELQPAQKAELMAEGGHREIQRVREVAHAQLIVGERVHDPDAAGIRQRLEDLCGVADHPVNRQSLPRRLDLRGVKEVGQLGVDGMHS